MIVLNDRTRLTDLVYKYHLTVPKALWGAFHFTDLVYKYHLTVPKALWGVFHFTDLVQYMKKHCLKQCFFVFFILIYSYIPLKFQRLPNRLLDLSSGLNPSAKFPYPTHFHHT